MTTPEMHTLSRRHWLRTTAGVLGGCATAQLWATPSPDARFLLVFLRGGYDAMSVLVPHASTFYHEVRPNIRIPLRDASNAKKPGADRIDAQWALHPSLSSTVWPMLLQGQAAFIPFSGVDNLSRSHFETQDFIEMGRGASGPRDFRSGFMNRLAGALGANVRSVSFTDQLPLTFRGSVEVGNVSLRNLPNPAALPGSSQPLTALYKGHPLEGRVSEAFGLRAEVAQVAKGEMEAASRNAISALGFELEARRIARFMRDRYALGFVDVGGWDTHVGQGATEGYLASRLQELGRGLAGFAEEMGPAAWQHTVVAVVSEFGRTFRENGGRGTDHGHGSVCWILGGGLSGAPVVGEQVALSAGSLNQNRDLPVLNRLPEVLAGLFARQFGLGATALNDIFPSAQARDLKLI